jgi:hypothetical protein
MVRGHGNGGKKGLYDVALDMSGVAGRIAEKTATQKDKEDRLILAGTAAQRLGHEALHSMPKR